jgi:hypothetical protein
MSSFANEGARNLAILSFKATLSAFCTTAATAAAKVELPLVDIRYSLYGVVREVMVAFTFTPHASMGNIRRRITMQPWSI